MRTRSAPPAREKAAPARGKPAAAGPEAGHEPSAVLPWLPAREVPARVQRRCACGGSCPSCSTDDDRLQTKLKVGEAGDEYEREADRMAAQVLGLAPAAASAVSAPAAAAVSLPSGSPGTFTAPSAAASAAPPIARRKAATPGSGGPSRPFPSAPAGSPAAAPGPGPRRPPRTAVPPSARAEAVAPAVPEGPVEEETRALPPAVFTAAPPPPESPPEPAPAPSLAMPAPAPEDLTRGGFPLPSSLRAFFESRFGRDFSDVRLHTGAQSHAFNRHLAAHAFTYGNHVWLGAGHAPAADFLLAHELAHVVQQRQPPLLAPRPGLWRPASAPALPPGAPAVRRLSLGSALPYWIPLDLYNRTRSGTALHREILGWATGSTAQLDIEVPAPNAVHYDYGLDYQGSIDLYRGKRGTNRYHKLPGIVFKGPVGEKFADVQATTPDRHHRATGTRQYGPTAENGTVRDLVKAPETVELGELKPASKPMLEAGDKQLGFYAEGMKYASRLTNDWLKLAGRDKEKWDLKPPTRLPKTAVKFKRNGRDMRFLQGGQRQDENLVLGSIAERRDAANRYTVKIEFDPADHGLPPIRGGTYAQEAPGDKGLWMYFSRPFNLRQALDLARTNRDARANMRIANEVQNQVIRPLLEPPKKKAPAMASKLALPAPAPVPLLPPPSTTAAAAPSAGPSAAAAPARAEGPTVRRKGPKAPPPKLEDPFVLKTWEADRKKLHDRIHLPTDQAEKKKLASLEFLEKAYEAEEALDEVPGAGKSSLPAKKSDMVSIVSGQGKEAQTHKRPLGTIHGWLAGWTSAPVRFLGSLRDKFGVTFTTVANKTIALKEKIKEKLKAAFKPKVKAAGKGKARIIMRALAKGLIQLAKLFVPYTARLVMDSIEAGMRKKLSGLFELDPRKLAEEALKKEFEKHSQPLDDLKAKGDALVEETVEKYGAELAWVQDVADKAKIVGPIMEAAAIGVQCLTPPGWGCLKILARPLQDCAIEAVLNNCTVQKEIAGVLAKLDPIANLPRNVAQKALDVMKEAAPPDFKSVFSEPVPKVKLPGSDEVECQGSQSELDCPDFLGFFEGGAVKKDDQGNPPEDPPELSEPPEPEEPPEQEEKSDPPPPQDPKDLPPDRPGGDADVPGQGHPSPEGKEGPGTDPQGDLPPQGEPMPDQGGQGPGGQGGQGPMPGQGQPPPSQGKPGDQGPAPQPQPQPGQGSPQPQPSGGGGGQGGGAPQQPPGPKPTPEPDATTKELQKLLESIGPQGMEALAELARKSGMPETEPLKPEQVKRIAEILKKAGSPSGEDLKKFADGQADDGLKKKLKPLGEYIETQAHRSVLKRTLDDFRKGKYRYHFERMAKHKVHWKFLQPYAPGPFRNLPALMWDEKVQAAGVVDGVFGECSEGGKVTVTITRTDMYDQTGGKILIDVPFQDDNARLKAGACPPEEGQKPKGTPQGGGKPGEVKPDAGEKPEPARPEAGEGEAEEAKPAGEGGEDADQVESGKKPKHRPKPLPADQGDRGPEPGQGKDSGGGSQGPSGKPGPGQGGSAGTPPDLSTRFEYCPHTLDCHAGGYAVNFEEAAGSPASGWFVHPEQHGGLWDTGTFSLVKPPNKRAILTLQEQPDKTADLYLHENGKPARLVGKAKKSPLRGEWWELTGGWLEEQLQKALKDFIAAKRNGKSGRSRRFHFQ